MNTKLILEQKEENVTLSKNESEVLKIINGYLETNTLTEEQRNKLVEYQNQKIDEQRVLLDQAKKGAQGLRDAQENTTPEMLDNIEKMKNYQDKDQRKRKSELPVCLVRAVLHFCSWEFA